MTEKRPPEIPGGQRYRPVPLRSGLPFDISEESILPSPHPMPAQEEPGRTDCFRRNFLMPQNAARMNEPVTFGNNSRRRFEFENARRAPFVVVVKNDSNAPAINLPVSRVPSDFRIVEQPLYATALANNPVVWPENLPSVSDMP